MKKRAQTALRSFIYGLIFFGVCGLSLQRLNSDPAEISNKIVMFLIIAGGVSFLISYLAGILLFELVKDLTHGND